MSAIGKQTLDNTSWSIFSLIKFFNSLLIVTLILFECGLALARINEKIYLNLQSNHFCERRLNATHQMGCSSQYGGNTGVIWIVKTSEDIYHVLQRGSTPPYIVVMREDYYTKSNLLKFKQHLDRVSGVVLVADPDNRKTIPLTDGFSPDDVCPNRYSGLYHKHDKYQDCKVNSWNQETPISGLLQEDIPYPIFLINQHHSIQNITKCFEDHNINDDGSQADSPLCNMQLDSFMLAARDTSTCLNSLSIIDTMLQTNSPRCTTVDNRNIFGYYKPAFGPLMPTNTSGRYEPHRLDTESVVMIVGRLSSISMFSDISPGADSTISSIVTMLAVAEALNKVRNESYVLSSKRNIAFALLDSEPYDYTGSNRMALDMHNNTFPRISYMVSDNITNSISNINLDSIDYLIDLDQMAAYPNTEKIFLHIDPENSDSSKFDNTIKVMSELAAKLNLQFAVEDKDLPLPPGPIQEFIRRSLTKENSQTSQENGRRVFGFMLSNFGKKYTNRMFNSIYDDRQNVFQISQDKLIDHITKVATFVANSAFQLAFKTTPTEQTIQVDRDTVKNLTHCYLEDAKCGLFTRALQAGQQLPAGPIQTYNDPIKRSHDMNGAITSHMLAYYTGDKLTHLNVTECYEESGKDLIYFYSFVNGEDEPVQDLKSGICLRYQVMKPLSESPAFSLDEDGMTIKVDNSYPAWTVSYNSIRNPVRVYLKPSPGVEWCMLLIGIFLTAASIPTIIHVKNVIHNMRLKHDHRTATPT